MTDTPTKRPRGRPPVKWDRAVVSKLAALQCTHEEIAAQLGIALSTFYELKKRDAEFSDILKTGKANGVTSLRSTLWQQSQKGSVAATIFLAKNYAGMSDRVDVVHEHRVNWEAVEASPDRVKLLESLAAEKTIAAEYYITDGEGER